MIRVALRLDDPSETSHQGVEAGILDALRAHRACATFAVIPFRMVGNRRVALSEARALPLIEAARAGVIEIAMHGHMHVRLRPKPASPSEFAGRRESEQCGLVAEGKAHLESVFGQNVSGFVPPWNSYDIATLRVLEQNGFRYLSAGWSAPDDHYSPIRLLPLTAHIGDVPIALAEAQRFRSANPVVVVVMHHFDFVESGSERAVIGLMKFGALLEGLCGRPSVKLCRLGDIARGFGAAPRSRRLHQLRMRHPRLQRLLPGYSILDVPLWRSMLVGAMNP